MSHTYPPVRPARELSPPAPRSRPALIQHSIRCPTCGHHARLGLTYEPQSDTHRPPIPTIVRFRCTNQMASTHLSPTNAQLLDVL